MTTLQDVDRRVTVIEAGLENLATSRDFVALTGRMSNLEERMSGMEARMSGMEARIETSATKADLAELETRLVKWMVGVLIGATVAASSVAVLVQSLIG